MKITEDGSPMEFTTTKWPVDFLGISTFRPPVHNKAPWKGAVKTNHAEGLADASSTNRWV
jgi:hypothetical protein